VSVKVYNNTRGTHHIKHHIMHPAPTLPAASTRTEHVIEGKIIVENMYTRARGHDTATSVETAADLQQNLSLSRLASLETKTH